MTKSDPTAGFMPSTTTMDLGTTKELISAFEKAFRNTRCNLPVFIPTGQLVNSLYQGYMCCWINDQNDKEKDEKKDTDYTEIKDFKVELRFNTTLQRDVPIGYSHLAGLTELFAQKAKITNTNIDSKNDSIDKHNKENDDDDYSRDGRLNITVAGLFTYELQNWDDEDWRRLDDENSDSIRPPKGVDTSFEEDLFLDETDNINVFVDAGSTINVTTNNIAPITSAAITASAKTPTSKSSPVEIVNSQKSSRNADFPTIHCPSSISNLPFGPSKDPLKSIILTAFFPSAPQDFYLDNDVFSEMDAGGAPVWIIKCKFALENPPQALLSGILENLISSWIRDRSSSNGSGYTKNSKSIESKISNDTGEIDNFVQALFDPSRFTKSSSLSSPLSYTSLKTCDGINIVSTIDLSHNIRNVSFIPYKSLLWNLLEYLLETVSPASNFQHCSSFIGSLKILWTEVLKHIRTYWERNIGIDMHSNILHQKLCMINYCITRLRKMQKENPKLSSSPISSRTRVPSTSSVASSYNSINNTMNKGGFVSIAEQKQKSLSSDGNNGVIIGSLSLYDDDSVCSSIDPSASVVLVGQGNSNGAIEHSTTINVSPNMDNMQTSNADVAESEDEPILTDASASPLDQNPHASSLTESFTQLNYPSSMESVSGVGNGGVLGLEQKEGDEYFEVREENMREGYLCVFKEYTLLKTGEPMWAPITQDNGLMTEDMIREQEEIFEKMGTSEEAAKKRDFIRWHSPRDWIPDESGDLNSQRGNLSPRMDKEGNFWRELWKSSRRIPVSRQKPLFNHSREGEKALRYLEQLSMQELFSQLLPTVFLIAYDTLVTHPVTKYMKPVAMGVSLLSKELTSFRWTDLKTENAFEKILERIRENELIMGKAISLLRKLPKQFYLVERILKNSETTVADGTEREAVYELFASGAPHNSAFPLPTTREFVLQTMTKPAILLPNISIHIPLRMYVLLNENGIRIIEMTSKQIID
ncbi:1609_t:CDS:10 [Ambispora gerdemannii]|uniref:Rab3 GTPase-activating protein catalytic subunit n=1 Tax=Ambispora gerdemannii TaxID=144530 RepID=A0A9N9C4Z4_9GLOM|nr:1609_t:CDS:10 [Ambispora gerdemannii]